jgi:hypothetical protein
LKNTARKPNEMGLFCRFAELFFKRLLVTHLDAPPRCGKYTRSGRERWQCVKVPHYKASHYNLRLCCKKSLENQNAECYLRSGGDIEEIGHESNLLANVAFPDSYNLRLLILAFWPGLCRQFGEARLSRTTFARI